MGNHVITSISCQPWLHAAKPAPKRVHSPHLLGREGSRRSQRKRSALPRTRDGECLTSHPHSNARRPRKHMLTSLACRHYVHYVHTCMFSATPNLKCANFCARMTRLKKNERRVLSHVIIFQVCMAIRRTIGSVKFREKQEK